MTHECATAVFVIHDLAAVRAAIQGARDAAMDLIGSSSICGLARRWGGIRRSMVHYFE
jgi:hypothetical protein